MSNSQHQKFIDGIIAGKTQTQAAIDAGYSPTSAATSATRLLKNEKIRAEIARRQLKHAEQADVTAADIVRVAWEIAQSARNEGARVSALNLLAKRHPEFSDKHDVKHSGGIDLSKFTDEQIERLADG